MPQDATQNPSSQQPPASRQAEEAVIRKAYADARQQARMFKKAMTDIEEQRKVIGDQLQKIKNAMEPIEKADAQLAEQHKALAGQQETLDKLLAQLKTIVDGLGTSGT